MPQQKDYTSWKGFDWDTLNVTVQGTLTLTLSPHGARELAVLFSNVPSPPRSGGEGQGEGAQSYELIFRLMSHASFEAPLNMKIKVLI